jgi:AcrR family transcriptional regulator
MNHSFIIVPRTRNPARLDAIVTAATAAFTDQGFARARIHQIATGASVGPGTVYLYAEDKEALFELALLRALESPVVAHPALPYQKTGAPSRKQLIEDCLHEITHFPQLWVASQRRGHDGAEAEYRGILLELARWLRRYRSAVRLAERNRLDWPELAAAFEAIVWNDLQRRLTAYLAVRMRAGSLVAAGDPALVARFAIDALVATLVLGPIAAPVAEPSSDEEALVGLVAAAVVSRHRSPLSAHPRQDSSV